MKLIPSLSTSKDREIAALKIQNQELEAELQKYKTANQQRWKERTYSHDSLADSSKSEEVKSISPQTPSYLRPTIASRSRDSVRAVQPCSDSASSSETVSSRYRDGTLLQKDDLSKAHFMEHTKAFQGRARLPYYHQRTSSPTKSRAEGRRDSVTSLFDEAEEDRCVVCERFEEQNASDRAEGLRKRSRLMDHDFYQKLESSTFIPFRIQIRLLKSALRLAQETLWCALRSHWPKYQRDHYLEGPEEVRFGREELENCFGSQEYPKETNQICGRPRGSVVGYIFRVVTLRNAICHPRHRKSQEIDSLIEDAQALAVVLLDEDRSSKIRKLRDELQAETMRSHEEIERRMGLASLPFSKEWEIHHQRYFKTMEFKPHDYFDQFHSSVALQAARQWKSMYVRPGEMNQEYRANVERAKELAQESKEHPPARFDMDYLYEIPSQGSKASRWGAEDIPDSLQEPLLSSFVQHPIWDVDLIQCEW